MHCAGKVACRWLFLNSRFMCGIRGGLANSRYEANHSIILLEFTHIPAEARNVKPEYPTALRVCLHWHVETPVSVLKF